MLFLAGDTSIAAPPQQNRRIEPQESQIHHVRSPRVIVRFETNPGAGPVIDVETWQTSDGAESWARITDDNRQPGRVGFDAPRDGVYGFFVILKNAFGSSEPRPLSGTPPHQWVRVDTAAPLVQVLAVRPDRNFRENREVVIRWRAEDVALSARPVALHYRTVQSRSFRMIAEHRPAEGTLRWTVPSSLTGVISIKASATDRAGNIGRNVVDSLRLGSSGDVIEPGSTLIDDARAPGRTMPPGQPVGTVPSLDQAFRMDPPAARATSAYADRSKSRERYDLGTWHRLRGEYSEAMARYREALESDPNLISARNDLAGLLFLTGRQAAAERELRNVLSRDPRHVPSLKSLALVQASKREYRQARDTLSRLLDIDSLDAAAWLYLGDVTLLRGDRASARQHWMKARDLAGSQAEVTERANKRLTIYPNDRLAIGRMSEP